MTQQRTTSSGFNITGLPAQGAYTVSAFCAAHGIGKSLFYSLKREGKAPRTIKAGRKTLISVEAAADWRFRMEAETNEAA